MKITYDIIDIQKGFKKIDNTPILDLESYIYEVAITHKAQLAGNKFVISIGTDSKFRPKKDYWSASYATVIAFTFGNNGTHLICREDIIRGEWGTKNRLSLYTRLWREVELSAALANWMKDNANITPEIHLDINPNEEYESNQLYAAAKGYIESLGFSVELKPNAAIASRGADKFLQGKTTRSRKRKISYFKD